LAQEKLAHLVQSLFKLKPVKVQTKYVYLKSTESHYQIENPVVSALKLFLFGMSGIELQVSIKPISKKFLKAKN
jgi:hypothetical protein